MKRILAVFLLISYQTFKVDCEVARELPGIVKVNKCCYEDEIFVGNSCTRVNRTLLWHPLFTSENGTPNLQIQAQLVIGKPDCGSIQPWSIYHYLNSSDRLVLLPNGVLRHYSEHPTPGEEMFTDLDSKSFHYDYQPGKYCLDKKIDEGKTFEFARVCAPNYEQEWMSTTEFLMRNIISPITHSIGFVCLIFIAVIYFILPTLRDLTGNIITTITMCLLVSQIADLIRLLTVFKSHISLIITETICYISLLGAFFWLNSLGYYIWKTFKSRNVFLRITDGKKYCYYCSYAWSCTLVLGALAVFAHFTLDYPEVKYSINFEKQREQIGSLGMVIFFVPVAFTVLLDVFFFATTLKTLNRMHTYGRIHHKLRHTFRMYLLLLLVLTIWWLFFLASFSKFEGLINSYIIVNTFLGPALLYICIFNQKHVWHLMKKTCCNKNCICICCRPEPESEWGDEMAAMNTGNY